MNTGKPLVNFESYIPKILEQLSDEKIRISSNAKTQINSFINCLAKHIAEKASFISNSSMTNSSNKVEQQNSKKSHTITLKDITSTCKIILGGEFIGYGNRNATKALNLYKTKKNTGTKLEKISRNKKASLILSISKTETILRTYHCGNIAELTPIYLAAILEYIIAEILDLSVNAVRDSRKHTISSKHLLLVIQNDYALERLLRKINWTIVGGGVIPYIAYSLLPKKKEKKEKKMKI